MKLKLVGRYSAGVVTAYYMCSENGAGTEKDEVDFEFLGNHYHTYSILWNNHQLVLFVDKVPIRVYKNSDKNADDWATRGGLEKTDWKKAPFVSSYKDFAVEGCRWKEPFPACVSTTTDNWWDQYDAWHLSKTQKMDYAWVQRNLKLVGF
ncbi:putative xyloglucan endotransglucosylase/hydrolase protein 8 [Raphanus sativus]|nr:putative xyloglucan endotransglucosylase/hydrolase protein 8 [Raphanus sativus]